MEVSRDDYQQLVLKEIAHLVMTDTEPVKLHYGSGTNTAKQLKILSRQYGVSERKLAASAVQLMFTCFLKPGSDILGKEKKGE